MQRRLLLGLCVFVCRATWAQYGGMGGFGGMSGMPTEAQGGLDSGRGIGVRPWAMANGYYTHALDNQNTTTTQGTGNGMGSVGVTVGKSWARTMLAGGYMGTAVYRRRGIENTSDRWGFSNVANIAVSHLVTSRLRVGLAALGGISDGGYGAGSFFSSYGVLGMNGNLGTSSNGLAGSDAVFGDVGQNGLVDNEIVYSRVKFAAVNANMKYALTQRVFVGAFGNGSIIRRSHGLAGTNMESGGGEIGYRLNQRNQIQASYAYGHIDYTGLFGQVRNQIAYLAYLTQLSPNTTLSIMGGVFEMRSQYNGAVALSPELAALLGTSTTLEVQNTRLRSAAYGAMLTRRFSNGNLSIRGDRGVAPGNGVMLASVRERVYVSFGQSITPRLGWSMYAGYARTNSKVGPQRSSEFAQGTLATSYRLWRSMHGTAQSGMRYLEALSMPRQRDVFVSVGLGWSPGETPLIF